MITSEKVMPIENTLSIIKPDATKRNLTGLINAKFEKAGLKIIAQKRLQLSKDMAQKFYEVHKERPFYGELVEYMSRGPIIAAILEKDNAVADFRTLIGSTNPEEADEGTIRKEFATSLAMNAVHGSDSDENANIEANFHFSDDERF